MKKLKIAGLVAVGLVLVLLAGLIFAGGAMIKGAVNTFGPTIMGVPVTLETAKFMPLRGKIQLTKLHVGNPEGFKTPSLFELGDVDIELNAASLFSDTIVIHKIFVNAPVITYERGLLGSNISKLTDQLGGGGTTKTEEKKVPEPEAKSGGKKVVIEAMTIRDPTLRFSLTATFGKSLPIALGQVDLKDIGKETGGVTFADAVKIIFSVITSNIENAVLGAGDLIGSGAKAVGSGAAAAGGAAVDGAASAVKGIGNLIGIGGKKDEKKDEPKDK